MPSPARLVTLRLAVLWRLVKWAAIPLVLLAVVVGGSVVAVRHYFPPERIGSLVSAQIAALLGREVSWTNARIGLRGVEITDLAISEAPDFSAGHFLDAERVTAVYSPRALLAGKILVRSVEVDGYTVRVVKERNGAFNVSSLGTRGSQEGGGSVSPPAFPAGIRLTRGTIEYDDRGRGAHYAWPVIEGVVTALDGDRSFHLDLTATCAENCGLQYAGEITLPPAAGGEIRVGLAPLSVSYHALTATLRGTARGSTTPSADVTLDVGAVSPGALAKLGLRVPPWLGLTPVSAVVHLTTKGNALAFTVPRLNMGGFSGRALGRVHAWESSRPTPEVEVVLSGKLPALGTQELRALIPDLPSQVTLAPSTLEVAAGVHEDRVKLKYARLKEKNLSLSAAGRIDVAGADAPHIALQLETPTTIGAEQVVAFVPALAAFAPSGPLSAKISLLGTPSSLEVDGRANLQGVALTAMRQPLEELRGTVSFSPRAIFLDLNGRWYSGALQFTSAIRDYRTNPSIRVDGKVSELDLAAVRKSPGDADRDGDQTPIASTGRFYIERLRHPGLEVSNVDSEWDLQGLGGAVERIVGTVRLRTGAGRFDNVGGLTSNPVARVLFFPIVMLQKGASLAHIPLLPSFDRVTFTEFTGNYAVHSGTLAVRESHLNSNVGLVVTSGEVYLGRQELNLYMATKVATPIGNLATPIGFSVWGSMDSPSVLPDPTAILYQPGVETMIEGGKKLLRRVLPGGR